MFKELFTESTEGFSKEDLKKLMQFSNIAISGDKVLVDINGKKKTLSGGKTGENRSDGYNQPKMEKKFNKFFQENGTFTITGKMAFSASMGSYKWRVIGFIEVENFKIIKTKWYM